MIIFEKPLNVVITAGASGIGKAIAQAYLEQNCRVFICDVSEEFLADFRREFPRAFVFRADMGRYEEVRAFFAAVQQHVNSIDVLVNNAGIAGPTARTEDILPEEWDRTISVNLNGMFYAANLAIPLLKGKNGGSIINIASSAAFFGFPYRSPYTASKWAVVGFTKTMAMELGPEGINVNAICPGSVKGPRIDAVIAKEAKLRSISVEQVKAGYERQVSLRKFVDVEDVTNIILFLTSHHGRMISGQAIGVDGHTETLTNY